MYDIFAKAYYSQEYELLFVLIAWRDDYIDGKMNVAHGKLF